MTAVRARTTAGYQSGCAVRAGPLRRRGRFRLLGFTAEAHALGQCRARRGVVWRDHRIVRRQAPFDTVFVRRQTVVGRQMPLQRLELLPVIQADNVVRRDRSPDGHSWIGSFRFFRRGAGGRSLQCRLSSLTREDRCENDPGAAGSSGPAVPIRELAADDRRRSLWIVLPNLAEARQQRVDLQPRLPAAGRNWWELPPLSRRHSTPVHRERNNAREG